MPKKGKNPLSRAYGRFYAKVGTANKREIKFNITFKEWYSWYLFYGKDMNIERLPKLNPNTLTMCRFGDKGSYSLDNIYAATLRQNTLMSNQRRTAKRLIKTPLGLFRSVNDIVKNSSLSLNQVRHRLRFDPEYYYLQK